MLPPERPHHVHVAFDGHRLVANAGLLLLVTLAHHPGTGGNWWIATLTWAAPLGKLTPATRC